MSGCDRVFRKLLTHAHLVQKAVLLFTAVVWCSISWGAEIVNVPEKDVQILGQITPGDADNFAAAIAERFPAGSQHNIVMIDSSGGDVYEAMLLGRLARDHDLMVLVEKSARCYSSCVLVLAGGTTRALFGSVGIHRPYFAAVGLDNDIQADYQRLIEDLRAYLREMIVPISLADLMMSVPPEKTKLLDENEIALYLPKEDPIADEIKTSIDAKKRGITTAELRQRQAKAEVECANYTRELEQAIAVNDSDQKFIAGIKQYMCREAISWGLSESEYTERNRTAKDNCPKDQIEECRRAILRGPVQ